MSVFTCKSSAVLKQQVVCVHQQCHQMAVPFIVYMSHFYYLWTL